MKVAYTVCSLNRLGQIRVLERSLKKYNPDYRFIVGLADELMDRIDVTQYPGIVFLSLSQLAIPEQENLVIQYDIFELSCALKAYYGNYIMEHYEPDVLLYFDTDICVYHSFDVIESALEIAPILLSPHFISPVPDDGKFPLERDVLNSGLYNGGFFAVKKEAVVLAFLQWWEKRVSNQGYNNVAEGMMVDQLWLNLVPLYFKTHLFSHPGCNLAYWNMHERHLTQTGTQYIVNEEPLVFFHFSGYRVNDPYRLSAHQNRHEVPDNSAIRNILGEYHAALLDNHFNDYLSIPCVYGSNRLPKKHFFLKQWMINILSAAGYKLEKIRKV